jgi:hypothetical protein
MKALGLPLLLTVLLLVPPAAADAAELGFLPGDEGFAARLLSEGEQNAEQAGSHPVALRLDVAFSTEPSTPFPSADLRDLSLELPPGLIENPTAVPVCSDADFHTPRLSPFEESRSGESCPIRTQLGIATLRSSFGGGQTRTFGLFNLAPPPGVPSRIGFNAYGAATTFTPRIRQADGEYGITLETRNVSQLVGISALSLTIWGVPWSGLHDDKRGNCLNEVEPSFGWSKCSVGRPKANPAAAYLTLPTFCDAPLVYRATARSWQGAEAAHASATAAPLQECQSTPFEPTLSARLSDPRASSPSGYAFDIEVDTSGITQPRGLAPTPVRRAVVSLPEGVTINPSVGAGLGVCGPGHYLAESVSSPPGAGCPSQSKIGDFTVETPLLADRIEGDLYLAAPYENPFGSLIAVYLIAKSVERGVLVKVAGELRPDPLTGRLTVTFDRLPQIPYSELRINFREGQRSPLATPAACGTFFTEADFTPWRDPSVVRRDSLPLTIAAGTGGGPCPSGLSPFTPKVGGGSLNSNAGSYSPFYLHLTRSDIEQEIVSYSATFPPGLLANLSGTSYCPEAAIQAAARRSGVQERDDPSCPAASRIGRTSSGYGVGSVLSYAPGGLYLAGPYRGSSFSVVAIDAALVGPFDLGVIVVRSAVRIDPETAQASIDATGTDPIPHIVNGIPIHLRDIRAYIDRPRFTLNPTSCAPFSIASALNGAGRRFADLGDDSLAFATAHFQAFNCVSLGFKPRIAMRLRGGSRRGKRPSLRVEVRPRPGNANIASAQVTLPDSLFLDQANVDAICTKPQFAAGRCPQASIYGKARAFTPLLEKPLEGPVYLRSSTSTLPDLVFALSGGGVVSHLVGRVDSVGGGIRGTFPVLPDAPVSKFVMTMRGGKRGILQVAENLCARRQRAKARFTSHSNRGWVLRPLVRSSCGGSGEGRR